MYLAAPNRILGKGWRLVGFGKVDDRSRHKIAHQFPCGLGVAKVHYAHGQIAYIGVDGKTEKQKLDEWHHHHHAKGGAVARELAQLLKDNRAYSLQALTEGIHCRAPCPLAALLPVQ